MQINIFQICVIGLTNATHLLTCKQHHTSFVDQSFLLHELYINAYARIFSQMCRTPKQQVAPKGHMPP